MFNIRTNGKMCIYCYQEYPLSVLYSHVLSCLSFNYLLSDDSVEGSDIVNDHCIIEIPTSWENGQHADNLQLKSENEEFILMKALLLEKNNKSK